MRIYSDVYSIFQESKDKGENIESVQLDRITREGKVFCAQNNSHEFQSGDTVALTNLSGLNIDLLMNNI